jgi:hypothetical protein
MHTTAARTGIRRKVARIGLAVLVATATVALGVSASDGSITFDKPTSETSVQELTDLVVAEYRAARTQKLRPDPSTNAHPAPGR